MAVPAAPVRVPSQRPLAPSVASVTSVANDNVDNKMILEAVHRSPCICLTAEENPRKYQLGDCWWRGCVTSHLLKWGPIPPNEVGRVAQHIRKGEGRKEAKDLVGMRKLLMQMYWLVCCSLAGPVLWKRMLWTIFVLIEGKLFLIYSINYLLSTYSCFCYFDS